MQKLTARRRAKGPLVIIHIPKAGGMTFKDVVNKVYGPSKVFDPFDRGGFAGLSDDQKRRYTVFMGHAEFGVREQLPSDMAHYTAYVCMLRDPANRALSNWCYIKASKSHFAHQAACEAKSVVEWHRSGVDLYQDNGMVRMLAGIDPYKLSYGQVDSALYNRACENLCRCSAVGFTNRYEQFTVLCKRMFDWPVPVYGMRSNSKPNRLQICDISTSDMDALMELEKWDQRLYEFAEKRSGRLMEVWSHLTHSREVTELALVEEARYVETLCSLANLNRNRWVGKLQGEDRNDQWKVLAALLPVARDELHPQSPVLEYLESEVGWVVDA